MLSMDVGTTVEFHVVYVVCVSRFRMGLGVGYVHVESMEYLQRDTEHDWRFIYMYGNES